jgi:hypothetical protein
MFLAGPARTGAPVPVERRRRMVAATVTTCGERALAVTHRCRRRELLRRARHCPAPGRCSFIARPAPAGVSGHWSSVSYPLEVVGRGACVVSVEEGSFNTPLPWQQSPPLWPLSRKGQEGTISAVLAGRGRQKSCRSDPDLERLPGHGDFRRCLPEEDDRRVHIPLNILTPT